MLKAVIPQPIPMKRMFQISQEHESENLKLRRIISALKKGIIKLDRSKSKLMLKASASNNMPLISKFMNTVADGSTSSKKLKIFERLLEDNVNLRKIGDTK